MGNWAKTWLLWRAAGQMRYLLSRLFYHGGIFLSHFLQSWHATGREELICIHCSGIQRMGWASIPAGRSACACATIRPTEHGRITHRCLCLLIHTIMYVHRDPYIVYIVRITYLPDSVPPRTATALCRTDARRSMLARLFQSDPLHRIIVTNGGLPGDEELFLPRSITD